MMTKLIEMLKLTRLLKAMASALLHAIVWFFVFDAFTEHPVAEWSISIVAIYAAWLVVSNVILFGLLASSNWLKRQTDEFAQKRGLETQERTMKSSSVMLFFLIFAVALILMGQGFSIAIANIALQLLGRTPLPASLLGVSIWFSVLGTVILFGPVVVLSALIKWIDSRLSRGDMDPDTSGQRRTFRTWAILIFLPVLSMNFEKLRKVPYGNVGMGKLKASHNCCAVLYMVFGTIQNEFFSRTCSLQS